MTVLETKNKVLDEERRQMEELCKIRLNEIQENKQKQVDDLQFQCDKLKLDLAKLSKFSEQRDEMALELFKYKALVESKDIEYRNTIHSLEREILQDKVIFLPS